MSPNRVVAALTPLVFAPLAGAVSAWLAAHFPGINVSPSDVEKVFIAGALIALAPAAQWLHGWQRFEARQADHQHEVELANALPPPAPAVEIAAENVVVDEVAEPDDELEDLAELEELEEVADADDLDDLDDLDELDELEELDDEPADDEEPARIGAMTWPSRARPRSRPAAGQGEADARGDPRAVVERLHRRPGVRRARLDAGGRRATTQDRASTASCSPTWAASTTGRLRVPRVRRTGAKPSRSRGPSATAAACRCASTSSSTRSRARRHRPSSTRAPGAPRCATAGPAPACTRIPGR